MMNGKNAGNLIRPAIMLAILMFGLSGCDSEPETIEKPDSAETPDYSDDNPGNVGSVGELLPFRIAFRADGTLVILDEKGNIDTWEEAKLPLETSTLYKLQPMTFAVVQGSCTVLMTTTNNTLVKKTYPSALCKYLGIPES